jgi:hypothetical protein
VNVDWNGPIDIIESVVLPGSVMSTEKHHHHRKRGSHKECRHKCSLPTTIDYTEQYLIWSAMADEYGNLPLHNLFENPSSSREDAMMMIEKYPAALRHQNVVGMLPLHIECKNQCRPDVIFNCIERYAGGLSVADKQGYLPLDVLLTNSKSSVEQILRMMEKYPAALKHMNVFGNLFIHIVCGNRPCSSIISKCIEFYCETLAVAGQMGKLPLHCLLGSESSATEDALMIMETYPAAMEHQNSYGDLPIHLECKYQCRSPIISKCMKRFPKALAVPGQTGQLPLHYLLNNVSSSEADALDMIEKYPAALMHENNYGFNPLSIESMNQARSSVIRKCIELYPEALFKADRKGFLALHRLLGNKSSDIKDALLMIEKHPAALGHLSSVGLLPLHMECIYQSRSSILMKCMELNPEALEVADCEGHLPLHCLLSNQASSTEDALMMIEKYPEALRRRNVKGELPLYIECGRQCRSTVMSKCIELYAASLDDDAIPMLLRKFNKSNFYDYTTVLSIIFTARPMSLYPMFLAEGDNRIDPFCRRRILHLLPRHIFTPTHESDYRDLNWYPRAALMMLLSQLKIRNKNAAAALAQFSTMEYNEDVCSHSKRHGQRFLSLRRIIKTSTLLSNLDVDMEGRVSVRNDASYNICQHEDLGDILLRSIFAFL